MLYALGVAQIISWGSVYYAIGVLGPQMARELGLPNVLVFGAFTGGLILSGLVSPLVGRMIDERGGRLVLSLGSVLSAAALALLGVAGNAAMVVIAWLLGGVAMAMSLYDPAFAAISQIRSIDYRRSVTLLTLLGALASTAFWPLAHAISQPFGWRAAWIAFALLELCVCLPIHLYCLPRSWTPPPPAAAAAAGQGARAGRGIAWLSAALALLSFAFTACVVNLIPLLEAGGLAPAQAVALAMLMGPMQVLSRVAELRLAKRFSAVALGYLPYALAMLALAALFAVRGPGLMAVLFVVTLGWGNGILTIARGTVPRELFGAERLGELLGRIARVSIFARALGPASLPAMATLAIAHGGRITALLAVALAGAACYARAVRGRGLRRST